MSVKSEQDTSSQVECVVKRLDIASTPEFETRTARSKAAHLETASALTTSTIEYVEKSHLTFHFEL